MTSKQEERRVKKYALGVLFVHGIGRQRQGDTLVRWGDQLAEAINRCAMAPRTAVVDRANLRPERSADASIPANAEMTFGGTEQRPWRLAESWWAEAFSVPSYGQLVGWSFRALPVLLALHLVRQFHQYAAKAHEARMASAWIRLGRYLQLVLFTVVVLPLILLLIPLFILLLLALLVIGLVPLPSVRAFVGSVQRTLAGTAGDSLIMLESPIQAAAMRSTILDALTWLDEDCEHIAIVAHSQGAALASEALGVLASRGPTKSEASVLPDIEVLVTFGAGINKLAALSMLAPSGRRATEDTLSRKAASKARASAKGAPEEPTSKADDPKHAEPTTLRLRPVWAAVGLLCSVLALGLGAWYATVKGYLAGKDWQQFGIFLGILLATSLLSAVALALTRRLKGGRKMRMAALAVPMALGFVGAVGFAILGGVNVLIGFLIWGVFAFVGAAAAMLEIDVRGLVRAVLEPPPRIRGWLDFYASSDPVPNGMTVTKSALPISTEIFNSGSMLMDHTEYWRNTDGFVIPVAHRLLLAAKSPLADAMPPTGLNWRRHAAQRVWTMCNARNLLAAAFLCYIVVFAATDRLRPIGSGVIGQAGSVLGKLPIVGDIWDSGSAMERHAKLVAIAALLLLWGLGYLAIRFAWRYCVRSEADLAFRGEPPPDTLRRRLILDAVLVLFIFLGFLLQVACYEEARVELGVEPGAAAQEQPEQVGLDWEGVGVLLLAFAGVAWAALWGARYLKSLWQRGTQAARRRRARPRMEIRAR